MRARIGLLLIGLVLMACAGILYTRSQGAVIPGLPARPLERSLEEPLASGDSLVVADFAHDRCRLLWGAKKKECYQEILLTMVERGQVRLAMDALSVLDRKDPDVRRSGHDYTHVVGINAWNPDRDVSAVYQSCTGLYQSGCYHGVVQAYLDANGTDSSVVASLCDQIDGARTSLWLRFQCVHGLGHGLVQTKAMHLPRALAGCDWLATRWDRDSCYGGAFMEFVVGGRGQSHHPHRRQGAADSGGPDSTPALPDSTAHGEHAHHEAGGAEPPADSFKVRDRSDPLYPCSVLEPRYQPSCFGMQAGIIIETTGADFGKIAAACDRAPHGLHASCYQGIGTYVSGFTVRDPVKADRYCSLGNPRWRAWCYVGVVKNFIDVTARPEDGIAFCERLTDEKILVACYVAVGQELGVLIPDLDRRERACAKVVPAYRQSCRYGAVLGAPRPPELSPET